MEAAFSRSVALLAALGLLGWPGAPARACSVCLAGDPVFDAHGAGAEQPGKFSAYFEIRGLTKKSGHLPGEEGHGEEEEHGEEEHGDEREVERNQTTRLRMLLAWSPTDALTLSLDVPGVLTKLEEMEGSEVTRLRTAALGDVTVGTSVVLWRDREVLPSRLVEARAFLKTPTGESREKTRGGRDPHAQAGTGSWDFGVGLAGTQRLSAATLYASAFYRENTEGSLDYEYGDVVLANLAVMTDLGHWTGNEALTRIRPGLELNYRFAQKDRVGGLRFGDSGGSVLYLTPSLRFQLPWFQGSRAPSLRTGVQIPLTQAWLNGFQREGEVWTAGVLVPF